MNSNGALRRLQKQALRFLGLASPKHREALLREIFSLTLQCIEEPELRKRAHLRKTIEERERRLDLISR